MVVASRVDQVLARAVEAGEVPGVVALAADDQGVVYEGAFGKGEVGRDPEMRLDTVVWIASMTKAVTSVAAMQLVEQGRIGLDEPLNECLPELAAIQVLDGFDVAGAPRLRPPRRSITLRHLLTHTAGFAYDMWNADILRYKADVRNRNPTLAEGKDGFLMVPLVFDPGDRWEYGINTDWVGQTVERLSGQSLEEYFREHIFDPLGMGDSGFVIRPDQRSRLAGMHARQPDGSLEVIAYRPSPPPEFYEGGGGLYSTGLDYLRFLRMLLGDGLLGDARVLRSETVAEMGRNQIGELTAGLLRTSIPFKSNDVEFFPGMIKKWSLGYLLTTEDVPTGRAAGSVAWAGLANTYYWLDPTQRLTGLIMTQILPFGDAFVLDLFERFERAVYADRL
jgi:CubicO group peptidase (beta-lactamase class C family)